MKVVEGVEDFEKYVDTVMKNVQNRKDTFNKERATKFRKDTIADTLTGRLGLVSIKRQTALHREANKGGPMYDTGEYVHAQKIQKGQDKSYESGYFQNNTEKHSDTDLTNHDLAVIHHAGAKLKNGGVIPARPHVYRSADKYDKSDNDKVISERWMKKHVFTGAE